MKLLKMIVCCDAKNGIGKNNKLPWSDKEEINLFKHKTIGNNNNCVIMGSKTYLSIPEKFRPLNNRKNVVLSKSLKQGDIDYNATIIDKIYDIIDFMHKTNYDEYWIIGGQTLYYFFLNHYPSYIGEIHISILKNEYNCDKFFPKIDLDMFKCVNIDEYGSFKHYIYRNMSSNYNRNMGCRL